MRTDIRHQAAAIRTSTQGVTIETTTTGVPQGNKAKTLLVSSTLPIPKKRPPNVFALRATLLPLSFLSKPHGKKQILLHIGNA